MNFQNKMTYFLFLLFILLIFGCKTKKTISESPNITASLVQKDSVVLRDTIFIIEADKSSYIAQLGVVNNKVVLIDANATKSKKGTLKHPMIRIENNKLSVECESLAQELFATWKETHQLHTKTITIQKPPIYLEKKLNWYQQTLMWLGGILGILVSIGLILKIKT